MDHKLLYKTVIKFDSISSNSVIILSLSKGACSFLLANEEEKKLSFVSHK